MTPAPYYRSDLALVHHKGFAFHADGCAPAILELLQPIRARDGVVLEVGCGSGALTRHLVAAGHRVVATDASPAMVELTATNVPEVSDVRRLALPADPLPAADAVVSVGHAVSYLPDEATLHRAFTAMARALNPGGVMVVDVCDLRWADSRTDLPPFARVEDDWAIITRYALPDPTRFVREITTFVRYPDGSWHRDDERHDNVLIDTSRLPDLLAEHGVDATVHEALGGYRLPDGLVTIIGRRR